MEKAKEEEKIKVVDQFITQLKKLGYERPCTVVHEYKSTRMKGKDKLRKENQGTERRERLKMTEKL